MTLSNVLPSGAKVGSELDTCTGSRVGQLQTRLPFNANPLADTQHSWLRGDCPLRVKVR